MLRFILKSIKGNKKMFILILFILSLISSFQYVYLSMLYTVTNIHLTGSGILDAFLNIIIFMIIFITAIIFIMICNYYSDKRKQDVAILLLCGKSNSEMMKYHVIQMGIILIPSSIIGIGLGIVEISLLNIIYKSISLNFILEFSSINVYILFMLACLVITIFRNIMMTNIMDMSISQYLAHKTVIKNEKPKKVSVSGAMTIFGILMIISSIYNLLNASDDMLLIYFAGSLLGCILIIKYIIPFIDNVLHKKILSKRNVLFVLHDYMNLSSSISILIIINALITPVVLMTFLSLDFIELQISLLTCFVISLIIILLIFILKFNLYSELLAPQIKVMKALGYKKKDLIFIENSQVLIFILMILLPIVVYGILLILLMSEGAISMSILYIMFGSYIVTYLIISIYMLVRFRKLLKEEYSYE